MQDPWKAPSFLPPLAGAGGSYPQPDANAPTPTHDTIAEKLSTALGNVRIALAQVSGIRIQIGTPSEQLIDKLGDPPGVYGMAYSLAVETMRLREELEALSRLIGNA